MLRTSTLKKKKKKKKVKRKKVKRFLICSKNFS